MKTTLYALCCALALVVGCAKNEETSTPADTKQAEKETASAYSKVRATLTASCIGCHGSAKPAEGVDLSTYESLMKGGEHGPIVVAGDPEKSLIIQSLKGANGVKRMPLNNQPLSEAQIKEIEDWIKDGAKK